ATVLFNTCIVNHDIIIYILTYIPFTLLLSIHNIVALIAYYDFQLVFNVRTLERCTNASITGEFAIF
ncbi:hypothetical protein, partial [Sphingobacterium sp. IITKGP-BTPF85]|uniref:hypothetical protein n=1 Tax=Sphingobacterium sp. IITKGP-BTPF85 TaxID=1338009 RepID=UPI00056909D6